jgi:hypothetical protein
VCAEPAPDVPLKVAADTPEPDDVNNLTVLPDVASANEPAPCVCADSFAAVGTPAGQEIAPSVNAPLAFVGTPAGQATVPVAVTLEVFCEAVPVKAGTPAGHDIVSAGMVPDEPVNVWADTVPALPVKV